MPDFSTTPLLKSLNLGSNSFSGSIPNFNLPALVSLLLNDNSLSGTIPDFDLPNLYLWDNQFIFSDVLNAWGFNSNILDYRYAPQDTISLLQSSNTLYVEAGGNLTDNHYTWYNDGAEMPNMPISGDSSLIVVEDGYYHVAVSNDIVTNPDAYLQNLILLSDTITIGNPDQFNCLEEGIAKNERKDGIKGLSVDP